MQHLVQEHSNVDRTYVEDFLLCFRIFIKDPMELADRLKIWFETPSYRNKVSRKLEKGACPSHLVLYFQQIVIMQWSNLLSEMYIFFSIGDKSGVILGQQPLCGL